MLTLHTSNQLEQLTEQFSQLIEQPLADAFTPETVVVQNSGMARYLSLQVADKNTISANTDFLFPADFMWKMLKSLLPNLSDQDPSSPLVIRWRLFSLLLSEQARDSGDEVFSELAHYLKQTEKGADSAWNLSLALSDMLDKVLFYRDDWVRDWENPKTSHKKGQEKWQARLWKVLISDNQLDHWLSLQDQFVRAINLPENKSLLPERITFFSLSALSPGYIRLLGEMGKVMDIHLFIINPSQQYWGDIEAQKQIIKKPVEEQAYYDYGNALLSSMGRQGRDFIDQLLNLPELIDYDVLTEQEPDNLLTQIQHDILNLETAKFNKTIERSDASIQFNACHTAMREVEVLHDQLLDTLQNNPTIAPSDIIVMMPDIDDYAPYIEAVFSSRTESCPKLPFSIADQNPVHAQPTVEAFIKVLSLVDKRFDVESVFELLDYDVIREQFNLKQEDVDFCREIACDTNIRWGINAESRKKSGLPNTDEHTWRYALNRLLLGYTLVGDDLFTPLTENNSDNDSVQNTQLPLLPFNNIEGSQVVIISHLIQFTDTLFTLEKMARQSHSIDGWLEKIASLMSGLFADDTQNKVLFKSLNTLKQQAQLADFGQHNEIKLPFSVILKIIKQALQEISGGDKFLGYGITFCALVPMRSVPFKVVALLGMNDGEYPRQDKAYSFDDVANNPRKGDRSRRNEDRYLFLESILAAREKLIISFIGQSVKDNKPLPPSVLVSELLDEMDIYTATKTKNWVCEHPLQAFSPRYFDGSDDRLFSYQARYTALDKNKNPPSKHFINTRLAPLADEKKRIHLDALIRFYQSPARAFLKQQFSINNVEKNHALPIREPFALESFKDRDIREEVFDALSGDMASEEELSKSLKTVRARGLLPYGDIGDKLFDKEVRTMETFIKQLPQVDSCDNQTFELKLGDGFTLYGELKNLSQTGRMIQQVGSAFAGDYIRVWFNHLVLNTKAYTGELSHTSFYSPELSFKLFPIETAKDDLAQLVSYYWQGMQFPLHFYAKPAFKQYQSKHEDAGLKEAIKAWNNNFMGANEKDKFENWLLYRGSDESELFDDEYQEITHLIFGQLFEHYESLEGS